MFTLFGPALIEALQKRGFEVFLDLKFHDIPNTVAQAVKAAASLGVWMVDVHASGGQRMLEAASEALQNCEHKPLLISVTVLTSMGADELGQVGIDSSPQEQVARLAKLSAECGLDGVVCSALEVETVKSVCGKGFVCVTPGIRPSFAQAGDQRRVMTPADALKIGSDYLVIGRPITQAEDPLAALNLIQQEIEGVS